MPRAIFHCSARYASPGAVDQLVLQDLVEQVIGLDDEIRADREPIYRQDVVWEVELQPGLPMYTVLFDDACDTLSRDLKVALFLAIDRAVAITDEELALREVKGQLGLFPSGNGQDLNSTTDWRSLVRHHLNEEPGSIEYFCEQCEIAFSRLKFSKNFPNCLNTFDGGFSVNCSNILSAFGSLNDEWELYEKGDLPAILRNFSTSCGFQTTLEGNGDRKGALTFTFTAEDKKDHQILCEPHMKLSKSDSVGDSSHHFHRIYFNPRPHKDFGDKVLIGHAGEHL